ncbi:hypothetical protein L1049_011628 [Liquidambar formosana]|uniref:RRM domain-containing protein n=1 Tax=Liquidambar formosana TaxID=63359 RepID=A0AAP0RRT0_LIQFO
MEREHMGPLTTKLPLGRTEGKDLDELQVNYNNERSTMAGTAAMAAAFGGTLPPGISGTNERCTVLVSNLNSDRIDEDKLFNLFSIYGNIVRIKLLRNKPDRALVQMGDGFQAELAVHFLKGQLALPFALQYGQVPETPYPDPLYHKTDQKMPLGILEHVGMEQYQHRLKLQEFF